MPLPNGQTVHLLHFPGCEVFRVEVIYFAGRVQERLPIAVRATARLMRDGTIHHTGAEVAERIDFYGGSLSTPVNLDIVGFVLHGLKKYAAQLLPILDEVLHAPTFPEAELATFVDNNIQQLRIDLEKGDVVAYRHLTALIFGEQHPYGYNSTEADYRRLTRDDLVEHYARLFRLDNCLILVTGDIDDTMRTLLQQTFGQVPIPTSNGHAVTKWPNNPTTKPKTVALHLEGSLQTSIKMGRRLFNRHHPDFNGIFVLNTVLGGYFGSRLMANIREKKGFTYNIYSTADIMLRDGYWYIGTEVNADKAEATLRAIRREMKKLRDEPIPDSELTMVRNYLLGMLLNGLDGPLNIADMVKACLIDGMPLSAFSGLADTIRTITADELQRLAQRYLDPKDFWTVVVHG